MQINNRQRRLATQYKPRFDEINAANYAKSFNAKLDALRAAIKANDAKQAASCAILLQETARVIASWAYLHGNQHAMALWLGSNGMAATLLKLELELCENGGNAAWAAHQTMRAFFVGLAKLEMPEGYEMEVAA
jgi:hypothetical protein